MNASMRPGEANILRRRSSLPPLAQPPSREIEAAVVSEASDRKRVLFASDRPTALEEAQRRIGGQLLPWDAEFALGSFAALGELAQRPFDAIVVDARLSGLEGLELLRRVRGESPSVARILVVDGSERDSRLLAVPRHHDFCLPEGYGALDLCVAVERACTLRRKLSLDAVRTLADATQAASLAPTTFLALARAFADPRSSLGEAARVVEADAPLSARVLRMANSVQLGPSRRITTVEQAVLHLGLEVVQGLALTVPVFGHAEPPQIEGLSPERVMKHSVLTARIARQFLSDPVLAEEACTAAFVHDLGVLALARTMPLRVRDIRRKARATLRPVHEVERAVLGACSAEVGAAIVDRWGLPFFVTEAVAFHRNPRAVWEGPCEVLAALHVADALVQATVECGVGREPEPVFDRTFLDRAGMDDRIPRWRAIAAREFSMSVERRRPL